MNEMSVDQGGGRERKVRVDYPSNSQKQRKEPEKPKVEKVIEGEVVQRKRSVAGRVLHTFIAEDSPSIANFVVMEILVPAAKKMISDIMSQGTDRLLWGEERTRYRDRPGYTSYNRIAVSRREDPRPPLSRQARAAHDFNDIIIAKRAEAEDVLDRLRDLVTEYGMATVSDLYDLVGLTGEFTDDKWGWYDLRSASIRAIRGGYLLDLPRTQPIT